MLPSLPIKQLLRPLISPDQFDFWAREFGSVAAWNRCFARVVARADEGLDGFTLRLRPNRNMPAYQSGQHINLLAVVQGRRISRSYSLTSQPGERDLSITLRREPDGLMSNWLYEHAIPGAVLEIGAVFGDMTLTHSGVNARDNLLFLAAGSGITPLYSLIRSALASGHQGKIQLLYWGKTRDHFYFGKELAALEKDPRLSVHYITTLSDADRQNALCGRISEAQVLALTEALLPSSPHIFMCGGSGFVGTARSIFQALGQRNVHSECFTPVSDQANTEDAEEAFYRVELTRSRTSLQVSSNTNLLVALENAGIAVESGCRMGICNTCSCPTQEGRSQDISTGLINTGASTRLCVSRARSNLILDL